MRSQITFAMAAIPAAFAFLLLLLWALPFSWKGRAHAATAALVRKFKHVRKEVPAAAMPQPIWRDVTPSPLVVRELDKGKATLMVRHRPGKGCTAHMIVWSSRKNVRIEDSHYDLGIIEGESIGDAIMESFISAAQAKMSELVEKGRKRKRASRKVEEAPAEPVPAVDAAPTPEPEPTTVVEDSLEPESAIKVLRFPSVYRGEVLEIGMLPKPTLDGVINKFGVRYRTPEGVEDVVWGSNLRAAFREAGAAVGDLVEILKIGRKTVEEGKAPMNLYKVAKLITPASA
jgi:hypothetical protein